LQRLVVSFAIPSPERLVRALAFALVPSCLCAAKALQAQDTAGRASQEAQVVHPELISAVQARYPQELRLLALEGRVLLDVMVDTMGRPVESSLRVVHSTDHRFEASARHAVLRARFRPGLFAGRRARLPVRVNVTFEVRWEEWLPRECLRYRERPDALAARAERGPAAEDGDPADLEATEERPEQVGRPARLGYPESLRRQGIQGRVLVEAVVDTVGCVEPESMRILEATHPGFRMPALAAVVSSRFRPGKIGGRPVRVRIQQPVNFSIR
jgi:TonB family protein